MNKSAAFEAGLIDGMHKEAIGAGSMWRGGMRAQKLSTTALGRKRVRGAMSRIGTNMSHPKGKIMGIQETVRTAARNPEFAANMEKMTPGRLDKLKRIHSKHEAARDLISAGYDSGKNFAAKGTWQ
jgi:hypothetical protein